MKLQSTPCPKVTNTPALISKLIKVCADVPMETLISNLCADIDVIAVGRLQLPVTLSDTDKGRNCYICDPVTACIDYAIEETRNFARQPAVKLVLIGLIRACAPLIRATGLGRQVQPNNWLFSTNPVPLIQNAKALRDTLIADHPDRAIVLRSLNEIADAATMKSLKAAGFQMVPARQIYIRDPSSPDKPKVDLKRDQKLLRATSYAIAAGKDFSEKDFDRTRELYHQLYVHKYTALNPQYTATFLRRASDTELLKIIGLRDEKGVLDGVVGIFENGNTVTVPLIGYDTSKPQTLGLYRILNAIAYEHAAAKGLLYNMSAGAAAFKRNRNAAPTIEYMAVYVAHLGYGKRAAVRVVKTLLDLIGVPLLKRYKL